MQETLTLFAQVGILTFVVAGMAGLGLSLRVSQILTPLRNVRMVILVLLANFGVIPGVAILAAHTLPMDDAAATTVILLGCCAGAPFLPTLAKLSKGDQGLSVGVMVLLMVVTIAFAPIVVPIAVTGAQVSPWDIAQSLLLFMLVPMALGLIVNGRWPDAAAAVSAGFTKASTTGLAIGVVAALVVTWRDVFASIGSWIFVGTLIVILAGVGAGWLSGIGRSTADKIVLGLGGAQRNIAAALVIAGSLGAEVVVSTLVAALAMPIVLILTAAEIGKHRSADGSEKFA